MRVLNLTVNCISKIEGLNNLKSLGELYLNNNQIIDLDGLNLPHSLEILSVKGNNNKIKFENLEGSSNLKDFTK